MESSNPSSKRRNKPGSFVRSFVRFFSLSLSLSETKQPTPFLRSSDAALLSNPVNAIQLEPIELARYIKARKKVLADAYQQLIETLRWRATAFGGVDEHFAGEDENEAFFQKNCPHLYRGYGKKKGGGKKLSLSLSAYWTLMLIIR